MSHRWLYMKDPGFNLIHLLHTASFAPFSQRNGDINLSGGQELHPTSHLEAVAYQVFYGQRGFPQVLH